MGYVFVLIDRGLGHQVILLTGVDRYNTIVVIGFIVVLIGTLGLWAEGPALFDSTQPGAVTGIAQTLSLIVETLRSVTSTVFAADNEKPFLDTRRDIDRAIRGCPQQPESMALRTQTVD